MLTKKQQEQVPEDLRILLFGWEDEIAQLHAQVKEIKHADSEVAELLETRAEAIADCADMLRKIWHKYR